MPPVSARVHPKRIVVTLDDPAFAGFFEFARTAYPDLPLTNAVREILLLGMGVDPTTAAVTAARIAAFNSLAMRMRLDLSGVLADWQRRFEAELGVLQASTAAGVPAALGPGYMPRGLGDPSRMNPMPEPGGNAREAA